MSNLNYELLKNALDASSLRQEAISSNIANVNTANYKVNQVMFESLLGEAQNVVSMTVTDELHMGYSELTEVDPLVSKRTNTTVKENGNNVDIDTEMADQAQNTLYYNALITQLNAKYSALSTVISG